MGKYKSEACTLNLAVNLTLAGCKTQLAPVNP